MARFLSGRRMPPLAGDAALLAARLVVGGFLIHGVWDNIVSTARMAEFARFLGAHGFPVPHLMAPLSVAAQFAGGLGLALGLFTRGAGLLVAANFVVALAMVDAALGVRGAYPSASLVVLGLILASVGPGRIALDSVLGRHRR